MISPLSGVLHEKWGRKGPGLLGLSRSTFGSPPATSTKMKTLRKIGPRRLPGLAQRPAAGALLPRATRSKGGEGRAQKFPEKERKGERKRILSSRPQWSSEGSMPSYPWLSQIRSSQRAGRSGPPNGMILNGNLGVFQENTCGTQAAF